MSSYTHYTDKELTALLPDGDAKAFAEIYRRNWQNLYNSAYKRMRSEEQCQDIVQNVFSDLWERKEHADIENISAYLHTAVRYQVIKQTTRNPQNSEFIDSFDSILTSPLHTDDMLLEKEVMDLVKLWIAVLPEKRREIFLMHYYEDLSTSEIAENLGITQKTVQNQLNTAAKTLRARLTQILLILIIIYYI